MYEVEIATRVGETRKIKGRARQGYLPCPECGVLRWKDVNKDGVPLYPMCVTCGGKLGRVRGLETRNLMCDANHMILREAIVYGEKVMLPYTRTCGKDCFECTEIDCNWE